MATSLNSKLVVFTGGYVAGQYNWSPFVNKLVARLRFSGISYESESGSMSDAPKGKIPYITLTSDEQPSTVKLGDSTLITKYLIEAGHIPDLNSRLSQSEKAQDFAIRSMVEDRIYFYQVRERWMKHENFYIMRDIGPLSPIPYPVRFFVGWLVYRKIERTLSGQGSGRYTDEEVDVLLNEGWESVANVLQASRSKLKRKEAADSQPFWAFGGDKPTEVDATIYGFLSSVLSCPANANAMKVVRSHSVLIDYASRIHDTFFPEYTKWE